MKKAIDYYNQEIDPLKKIAVIENSFRYDVMDINNLIVSAKRRNLWIVFSICFKETTLFVESIKIECSQARVFGATYEEITPQYFNASIFKLSEDINLIRKKTVIRKKLRDLKYENT